MFYPYVTTDYYPYRVYISVNRARMAKRKHSKMTTKTSFLRFPLALMDHPNVKVS